MHLTRYEEEMLNGEFGEVKAKALKTIVKVGEALGAEELVRVHHVHISGVSYFTIGDAGLEFLEEASKGRVEVYTTCNPAGLDLDRCFELGFTEVECGKQREIISCLERMGVETTCTCTPYYLRRPRFREDLAWGESNAVLYANSVLGARSNRLGGPLTVMAALTGRAPRTGLYLEEERKPTVKIVPSKKPENEYEWGSFGYELGKVVGTGVPYLDVKPGDEESLRSFLAGVGTSSSIGLVLLDGISPEAKRLGREDLSGLEKVIVEYEHDVECGDFEAVIVGCPHYRFEDLVKVEGILRKFEGRVKIPFYILTGRTTYNDCVRSGIVGRLESRGISVIKGACLIVSKLRYKKVLTNSSKASYYLSNFQKIEVSTASLREILEVSFKN